MRLLSKTKSSIARHCVITDGTMLEIEYAAILLFLQQKPANAKCRMLRYAIEKRLDKNTCFSPTNTLYPFLVVCIQ